MKKITRNYSNELNIAKKLAFRAGKIMLQYFDTDQKVKVKADKTMVTIADTLINQLVITELAKKFPSDGVIGEEQSTTEYGGGRKWFCDPIDGTHGYIWGLPVAMFSLALVIDGRLVLGVAYDPFLKRIFYGTYGEGSFCNGEKLQVSRGDLNNGYVAITSSVGKLQKLTYISTFFKKGSRLSVFPGAVYKSCLVAKGRITAYIETGLSAHDVAAVQVIVEEAGGKITGMKGEKLDYRKPFRGAIISNGKVHNTIVKIVNAKNK